MPKESRMIIQSSERKEKKVCQPRIMYQQSCPSEINKD
jgi:hypothetical protein